MTGAKRMREEEHLGMRIREQPGSQGVLPCGRWELLGGLEPRVPVWFRDNPLGWRTGPRREMGGSLRRQYNSLEKGQWRPGLGGRGGGGKK